MRTPADLDPALRADRWITRVAAAALVFSPLAAVYMVLQHAWGPAIGELIAFGLAARIFLTTRQRIKDATQAANTSSNRASNDLTVVLDD